MCHDPLSQKFSFAKENMGYAKRRKEKKIHAKKHERKKEKRESMLKSMKEKENKETSHIFKIKAKGRESCKKGVQIK
jgi:hypothetical protein